MKNYYLLTFIGDNLPKDMSKDIAAQLDCAFLRESEKPYYIHVEKVKGNNQLNKIRR